jgi:hypothetical protein
MKELNIKDLPLKFAHNIVYEVRSNKKGYVKLFKNQLSNLVKTSTLVGELEILELIALKFKATKEHEIDDLIEFIDKYIDYTIQLPSATKIKKSELLKIAENSYSKGLKNAAKLMTVSIMECDNYDEVIGDIHIRIQDIWNNKLDHTTQAYRKITVDEYV